MTPKEIGAEMRRARKYKKWTQKLTAGKLGLSSSSVCRYETQTEELTLRCLLKAVDILGLELIVRPKHTEGQQLKLDI